MITRVLLIDGDDRTRQQSAEFLRSVGFHVVAVPDAHGAVDLARESRVDIVVTDAKPRGAIDGIEVARRLRGNDGDGSMRVVVLIKANDDDARTKARAVGCHAVLDKSCKPAALASEIRCLVAERPPDGHAHVAQRGSGKRTESRD